MHVLWWAFVWSALVFAGFLIVDYGRALAFAWKGDGDVLMAVTQRRRYRRVKEGVLLFILPTTLKLVARQMGYDTVLQALGNWWHRHPVIVVVIWILLVATDIAVVLAIVVAIHVRRSPVLLAFELKDKKNEYAGIPYYLTSEVRDPYMRYAPRVVDRQGRQLKKRSEMM